MSDGQAGEIDIIAEKIDDDDDVLVGEVKHSASPADIPRLFGDLESKAGRCPELKGKKCTFALWVLKGVKPERNVLTAGDVIGVEGGG